MNESITNSSDWIKVTDFIKARFEKEPDVRGILFIIGLREMGFNKTKFTKEQKQDLMNLGACTVLSLSGYFRISSVDIEGWPSFEQILPIPAYSNADQETILMEHIIKYFKQQGLII